jgi:hypothetical protein
MEVAHILATGLAYLPFLCRGAAMTLTDLVPTLEVCQSLRKAGFLQDTALVWVVPTGIMGLPIPYVGLSTSYINQHFKRVAAPTAEEILKELPETYDSDYYLSAVLRKGYAHVGWYDWDDEYLGHVDEGEGQSLVQAAALAYLWWKEQK